MFLTTRGFGLSALVLFAANGCGDVFGPITLELPRVAATVTGTVAAHDGERVLVQGTADPGTQMPRTWVATSNAAIRRADGRAGHARDLAVGQSVRIWTVGGEQRSYPSRVTAKFIAIDP